MGFEAIPDGEYRLEDLVTLAELARRVGKSPKQLKLWVAHGLRPPARPTGRGRPRGGERVRLRVVVLGCYHTTEAEFRRFVGLLTGAPAPPADLPTAAEAKRRRAKAAEAINRHLKGRTVE